MVKITGFLTRDVRFPVRVVLLSGMSYMQTIDMTETDLPRQNRL